MSQETINNNQANQVSNNQTADVSALLAQISNPEVLKALMAKLSPTQLEAMKKAEKETKVERELREKQEKEAEKQKEEQVIRTSEKVTFCLRAYYKDSEGKEKSYWRELKNDAFNALAKVQYFEGFEAVAKSIIENVDFSAFSSSTELKAIAAKFTEAAKVAEKVEKEAAK